MSRPIDALLDPAARPVIGHRGASATAPENTIASFAEAVGQGADGLELDVHVTADGVPVVIHDPTLDRTTDRAGAIAALPLAAVRAADAGARFTADGGRTFPWRGRGVRVPSLTEVLDATGDVPLIVELKTPAAAPAVYRVLSAAGASGRCLLASFDSAALELFDVDPWVRSASRREVLGLIARGLAGRTSHGGRYRALTVPPRAGALPIPMRVLAGAARRAGCPTHVWVVDQPAGARALWRAGCAGMITNRPAAMLGARGAGLTG